jgi:hypothetical protein
LYYEIAGFFGEGNEEKHEGSPSVTVAYLGWRL